MSEKMKLAEIPLKDIKPSPNQPRKHFDNEKIRELADSIREAGLLQPLIIRQDNNRYELIAGERRFRALQMNKEKTAPVIIRAANEIESMEISLTENWQRENLTSIERENMVSRLWNSGKYKNYTSLAKALGANHTHISDLINARKFRDNLPKEIKVSGAHISTRDISETSGLPQDERIKILKRVEKGELGSRKIRDEVKYYKAIKSIQIDKEYPRKNPMDYVNEINKEMSALAKYCELRVIPILNIEFAKFIWLHYQTYLKPYFDALQKRIEVKDKEKP